MLKKTSANTYERVHSDGTKAVYDHFIGTTGVSRRVFLTELVDPFGNSVTLEYDTDPLYPERLKKIYDESGFFLELFYAQVGEPYLVTKVEEPTGRKADFIYQTIAGELRLETIRDMIGLESSFGYNTNGEINSMTTPYGTTTFVLSDFLEGAFLKRWIEAKDSEDNLERIEYNLDTLETGVPPYYSDPTGGEVTPDPNLVTVADGDNDDRNTFYWDKEAMHAVDGLVDAVADYRLAHLFHWKQANPSDFSASVLDSEKPANESRIWYQYPG